MSRFLGIFRCFACLGSGCILFGGRGRGCFSGLLEQGCTTAGASGIITRANAATFMRWLGGYDYFGVGRQGSPKGIDPRRVRTWELAAIWYRVAGTYLARWNCHRWSRHNFDVHLHSCLSGVLAVPLFHMVA